MNQELTERKRDALQCLEAMNEYDILDMNYIHLWELTCGFEIPSIVRAMVAKGHNKVSMERIFYKLQDAYKQGWNYLTEFEQNYYLRNGLYKNTTWYFGDIADDVANYQPLVPSQEEGSSIGNSFGVDATLKARIAELEAENRQFKEDNEALKRQQLEECQSQPQASEVREQRNDEWLVELLEHHFYENEREHVKEFINEISGKEDHVISDIIAEWVKEKKRISLKTYRGALWRILHAAKLYSSTESNYNTALNRRLRP